MIHGRISKTSILVSTFVVLLLFVSQTSSAQTAALSQVTATVKTEGDTINFQFSGKDSWEYKVERVSPTEIELTIPKVRQEALGNLIQFSDGWIKRVDSIPSDAAETSKFKLTLLSSDVEHFDYLTDQPSRLIIDVYKKDKSQVLNAEVSTPTAPIQLPTTLPTKKKPAVGSKVKSAKTADYSKSNKDRNPASDEILVVEEEEEKVDPKAYQFLQGIFDSGDTSYKRFQIRSYEIKEESIIAAKNNIYIRFPILKLPTTRLDYYKDNPPEFVIEPKENP